jgi:hypothetical protein
VHESEEKDRARLLGAQISCKASIFITLLDMVGEKLASKRGRAALSKGIQNRLIWDKIL